MHHSKNALLARIDARWADQIYTHLRSVELQRGDVVADAGQSIQNVYFPHSGIVSCLVLLNDGSAIQTAMIGRDGQYGGGHALDDKISLNRVVIQTACSASVMDADQLRQLAEKVPIFRKLVIAYDQFSTAEMQQTAACNVRHSIEERMCRWLLRMYDLAGAALPLTQEVLADMIGARRTSVTECAGNFQRAGLISYKRGHLHIEDVQKIRNHACECHDAVKERYQLIFQRYLLVD